MLRSTTLYRLRPNGCDAAKHEPPFCYHYETRFEAELAAFAWLYEHAERELTRPHAIAKEMGSGVDKDLVRVRLKQGARLRLSSTIDSGQGAWFPRVSAQVEFMRLRKVRRPKTEIVAGIEVTNVCETVVPDIEWTDNWGRHHWSQYGYDKPVVATACIQIVRERILFQPPTGTPWWFRFSGGTEERVEPPESIDTPTFRLTATPYRDGSGYDFRGWLQAESAVEAEARVAEVAPHGQRWVRQIPPHHLPEDLRP